MAKHVSSSEKKKLSSRILNLTGIPFRTEGEIEPFKKNETDL